MKAFALLNHRSRRTLLPFTLLLAALLVLFAPQAVHAQYPSHQKISDTAGNFTGVLDDQDGFGSSVATLGDLDGDGIPELAVGAWWDDDGGTNRGAVWILFMNSDGTVRTQQKISDTAGLFFGTLEDSDFFGDAVAPLGDFNGDGIPDLLVGGYGADTGGAVWILLLRIDGTVLTHYKISDTSGGFTGTINPFDFFGGNLTSLGDLNGDGILDIAVTASGDDEPLNSTGSVWILFMDSDGTVKGHQKLAANQGGVNRSNSNFGRSIVAFGDLDGDSVNDLAVGVTYHVWVLLMNTDGTVKDVLEVSNPLDDTDSFFGSSLARVNDVNGDGLPDLAAGNYNANGEGLVQLLFLNADGTLAGSQVVSDEEGGFAGTIDEGDYFGYGIASLGDLNGDTYPDLAVAARRDDDGGLDRGAVWILFRDRAPLTPRPASSEPLVIGDVLNLGLVVGSPAAPVESLLGLGFELSFDPALLSVTSVLPGAFLDDGDLLFFSDIDNTNGRVSATASRKQGAPGVKGNGAAVQIRFDVLDSGEATFTLSEVLSTQEDGTLFDLTVNNATIPLNSIVVWPGDTDNNGTVNVDDLLPIGTYFDTTGPARTDESFDWAAKGVVGLWSPPSSGYADAIGDGEVNQNDVLPIAVNFGNTQSAPQQQGPMTQAVRLPKATASVPYRLRVYHNRRKHQARARLVLGSGTNPAADLLGLATTLTYDPGVYSFRSHTPGQLLDDGDLLSLDDKQDGSIAVAYTRKAPNGAVSGRGPVLDVLFDVIGEPHDEAMTLQSLTLGTTEGSIAVVGPDAVAARAELGLDTAPAEPVVAKAEEEAPVTFALQGAYPNPFNPATTIAFDLPDRADVSLIVVDLLGREVRRLDLGSVAAGAGQSVRFAAEGLPSGMYLYRIEARTSEVLHTATGRVTLVR